MQAAVSSTTRPMDGTRHPTLRVVIDPVSAMAYFGRDLVAGDRLRVYVERQPQAARWQVSLLPAEGTARKADSTLQLSSDNPALVFLRKTLLHSSIPLVHQFQVSDAEKVEGGGVKFYIKDAQARPEYPRYSPRSAPAPEKPEVTSPEPALNGFSRLQKAVRELNAAWGALSEADQQNLSASLIVPEGTNRPIGLRISIMMDLE